MPTFTTAQPGTAAAASPPPGVRQALTHRSHDGRSLAVLGLPVRVFVHRVLAGLLLALPCSHEALALPAVQPLHQAVNLDNVRPGAVAAGGGVLSQQPGTDWISRLVEFLAQVPPQCRAVANQQPDQECQQRKKGVLEQLKHDHPVLFNLAVAAATFVLGFYITGGFTGGGK